MNESNFDRHLREKLGRHQTPVDTDAIWSAVQAGMVSPPAEKSPVRLWFWLILLLLLISFGTGWWFINTPENQALTPLSNSEQPINKNLEITPESEIDKSQNTIQKETEQQNNREEYVNTNAGKSVNNPDNKNSAARESEITNNTTTFPTNPKSPAEKSNKTLNTEKEITISGISAYEQHEERSVDSKQEKLPAIIYQSDNSKLPNENLKDSEDFKDTTQQDDKIRPAAESEDLIPTEIDEAETNESTIQPYPLSQIDSTNIPSLSEEHINPDVIQSIEPEFSPSVFVRAGFGIGLIHRKLQSLHSDWDVHTSNRVNTEKPMEHINGQLVFGYRLPSGFYGATGISFTQITERFHVDRNYDETEIIENHISEIHIDENGDSTLVYTNQHIMHHFHQEVLTYNKYTLIDLPVIIGYDWKHKRFSLGLEAGININLTLRSSGKMLAPTDEIVTLEESGMYRSKINLSYLVNLNAAYAVNKRFAIFLSPGVHLIPNSLLKQNVQNQAYTLYSIRVGTLLWIK